MSAHRSPEPSDFRELLELEEIAADLFVGYSPIKGRERVYGGQVVAQALTAAHLTVGANHRIHSLHGYFIRPGDETSPIVFDVDRIRDGRSFTTRRVVARQSGGAIFNLSASFHKDEPDIEFSRSVAALDDVKPPEECIAEDWDDLSEIRMVPDTESGRAMAWIKIARPANLEDATATEHATALAYCSDHIPMDAIRRGHPSTGDWETFMGASLDHAVWFHRPARGDQWLLFDMRLQSLQGSRGVAHGTVHDQSGALIATIAQEGLLRRIRG